MFGRSRPQTPSSGDKQGDSDPDATISRALKEYEAQFRTRVAKAPDADAESAKGIVERANRLVTSSGLGTALASVLLEHIQYWPSWSKRDDFQKWVKFPARYIDGSQGQVDRTKTTVVTFSYRDSVYSVRFKDQGMNTWATDDPQSYGTVELLSNESTLLGLDIAQDLSRAVWRWRWFGVFAFLPGTWMMELLEIAAYIEAARSQDSKDFRNEDALRRASQIKLPD